MSQSLLWTSLRIAVFVAIPLTIIASGAERQDVSPVGRTNQVVNRIVAPLPRSKEPQHPLTPVLEYVAKEQAYLRQSVRDFTCRLTKRERIAGILKATQYIDLQVREEVSRDGRLIQPLSVFAEFLGPAPFKGRKVLYISGRNDDKMLVHNGGRHFRYVVVKLDPNGETALKESRIPITEVGFTQMTHRTISILQQDMQIDPTGKNTQVEQFRATINLRPCTALRITHPQPQQGLLFHVANVFVDDELSVPVRLDSYDFPRQAGGEPVLLAEYTYTDLQVNTGLPDAQFDIARLRDSP